MAIEEWSDEQVENMIRNYRAKGASTGGIYSLPELLIEQERRKGKAFSGHDVVKAIVRLSKSSPDGFVTYKEIWEKFHPDKVWQAYNSLSEARSLLSAAVHYCFKNDLPIVTAVVVQTGNRENTDQAKSNMYEAAKEWGLEVGPDAKEFVALQVKLTQKLNINQI